MIYLNAFENGRWNQNEIFITISKDAIKSTTPYKHGCVTVKAAAPFSYTEGPFTFFLNIPMWACTQSQQANERLVWRSERSCSSDWWDAGGQRGFAADRESSSTDHRGQSYSGCSTSQAAVSMREICPHLIIHPAWCAPTYFSSLWMKTSF